MKKHRLDTKALKSGKPKGPLKEPPFQKPGKRKVHKARLMAERLNEEASKRHPEPLTKFHDRERGNPSVLEMDILEVGKLKQEATLGRIQKAAEASAEWNNSDPFAYGRTALYVKQGWLDPQKVVDEYRNRTLARRAARAKEVDDAAKR